MNRVRGVCSALLGMAIVILAPHTTHASVVAVHDVDLLVQYRGDPLADGQWNLSFDDLFRYLPTLGRGESYVFNSAQVALTFAVNLGIKSGGDSRGTHQYTHEVEDDGDIRDLDVWRTFYRPVPYYSSGRLSVGNDNTPATLTFRDVQAEYRLDLISISQAVDKRDFCSRMALFVCVETDTITRTTVWEEYYEYDPRIVGGTFDLVATVSSADLSAMQVAGLLPYTFTAIDRPLLRSAVMTLDYTVMGRSIVFNPGGSMPQPVAEVPEPEQVGLFALGLFALGARQWIVRLGRRSNRGRLTMF